MFENWQSCRRETCCVIGQRIVYNNGGRVDRCGDHEINRILCDKYDVIWSRWHKL